MIFWKICFSCPIKFLLFLRCILTHNNFSFSLGSTSVQNLVDSCVKVIHFFYFRVEAGYCQLYILTSVWVLHTQNVGQNIFFQFCCMKNKEKEEKKEGSPKQHFCLIFPFLCLSAKKVLKAYFNQLWITQHPHTGRNIQLLSFKNVNYRQDLNSRYVWYSGCLFFKFTVCFL